MKKVLFIAAILASSISFAQQEISPAQQELSRKTTARVQDFNSKMDAKVDKIMDITKLESNKRNQLSEIVTTKEVQLNRLSREGKEATDVQGRKNDIMNAYQTELKELLGESKYNLLQSKVSPK